MKFGEKVRDIEPVKSRSIHYAILERRAHYHLLDYRSLSEAHILHVNIYFKNFSALLQISASTFSAASLSSALTEI